MNILFIKCLFLELKYGNSSTFYILFKTKINRMNNLNAYHTFCNFIKTRV